MTLIVRAERRMGRRRSDSRVAILGYHKVGAPVAAAPTPYYVSVETFRSQLDRVVALGWRVISLEALTHGLTGTAALPRRAVVLTFDDAYKMLRHLVAPVLAARRLPSAVFVPVDYVGRLNGFDRGIEPEEEICDWSDLRSLRESGMSIESHGMSHRRFSSLRPDERLHELVESKRHIERRLAAPVRAFAYPYGDSGGDAGHAAMLLRAAGYKAGCLFGGGVMSGQTMRRYALERIPVGEGTDVAAMLG